MRRTVRSTLLALVAVLAVLATACGDDDAGVPATGDARQESSSSTTAADAGEDFPVSVTSNGVETTIEARPEAIVSLSPTATEMLFAIGAGDQVVAVDDQSDFPPEAPTTDLSGYQPNLEAIIAQEPDLVVLAGDADDIVAGLGSVDVATLVIPAAMVLEDSYDQIELLGAATGHVDDAAEVVAGMQADIDELVAQVPERSAPLSYYHELDDTLYTVTSQTFIGEIYSLAGLENVADAADADGAAGGYPQLSAELLVHADPDLVFLADTECCAQNLDTVSQRPGFADLRAVQEGHVVELDDDIASRWGPRVVDFLRTIIDATSGVEAPVG